MNMNVYLPTRLVTGKDCVINNSKLLKNYGNKCLIVTGKSSAKVSGAYADVTKALEDQKMEYVLFDEIGQNPHIEDCMRAAKIAVENNVDFILGIGGGSPLDAAKCIAVFAANDGYNEKDLYSLQWENTPLPIVCVGTTAGTGSEVTSVSVITNSAGRKKSFKAPTTFPALSLGDYKYTTKLSDYFTRSTAADALAHCVESYFNKTANEISQSYAIRGVQLLLPMLDKMIQEGTEALSEADREQLYNGSIYGGMAINVTGTALPHAVGYLLTEQHQLPHGIACVVFLPVFHALNKKHVPELVERFLKEVHTTEEDYLRIIQDVLPKYKVEMDEEEIEREHARWVGNGSIGKTHGNIQAEEVDEILKQLFIDGIK